MPDNIAAAKLQDFITSVQESLLTSNNILDRTQFPYYYHHSSVPQTLATYKRRLAVYRERSSDLIAKLAPLHLPQAPLTFKGLSKDTFAHTFIGSTVIASYGMGDCGECTTQLATKLIQVGHGNIAFISIQFTKAKEGMETCHQFIIANVSSMPRPTKEVLSVYEFFAILPENAIIADAFLGLSFDPKQPPQKFIDYINAYGGDTQLTQCIHLYNFTTKSIGLYIATAADIKRELKSQEPLIADDNYTLSDKLKIRDTSLITLLKQKSVLPFFGVRDENYKVDAVVELASSTERKAAQQLRRSLKGHGRFFELSQPNKSVFVLEGINLSDENPKLIQQIQCFGLQK